jgi:hypothetical protein
MEFLMSISATVGGGFVDVGGLLFVLSFGRLLFGAEAQTEYGIFGIVFSVILFIGGAVLVNL